MIEKIKEEFKINSETVTSATRIFEDAKNEIHKNYKDRYATEKLTEAKNAFEEAVKRSKDACFANCVDILNNVRVKAEEIISKPVSGEFTATLEAIKAIKEPTETEINSLMARYKDNYFSYRAIADVLGGVIKGYKVVTIDEITELLNDLESAIRRAIFAGSVNSYGYRNIMEGTIIDSYDTVFTTFCKGHFEDSANALHAEEDEKEV